ncbi:hypothetical protein CVS40_10311 [Lucilia cuprina]|nr:hypothetical protein CVS40_10311 [Lucilia cuprina]
MYNLICEILKALKHRHKANSFHEASVVKRFGNGVLSNDTNSSDTMM